MNILVSMEARNERVNDMKTYGNLRNKFILVNH